MTPFAILLAKGDWDWIVPVVVFAFYAISHIASALGGKGKKPQPPKKNAPAKPAADPAAEFLREAAKRRAEQQAQAKRAARPSPPPPPRPTPKKAPRRLVEQVVEAEVVSAAPTGEGVDEHVKRHLDNREFAERTSHLGHLQDSTQKFGRQIERMFDHKLGTLAVSGADSAAEPVKEVAAAPLASHILDLMTNPENVRQAIVLREIFERPVDRW